MAIKIWSKNDHSLEAGLLYSWAVAWLGSKIIQKNPKMKNPWCSHHTKAKAKLNAVNRCVLHCHIMQLWYTKVRKNAEKFERSFDKRAAAGHQGKVPRLQYCVSCADFDTSFHLLPVLPLGGTAAMALRFPHHLHCAHFWSSADKMWLPQWDFHCDTEMTLLNVIDKTLSCHFPAQNKHGNIVPGTDLPRHRYLSSLHFYILIFKLLGRMVRKAAEYSGL